MSQYPSYEEQFSHLSAKHKNILKKIPHLASIDGWLLLTEATTLYKIASNIKKEHPVICEIGVWKGKSSYVLANAIKDKNGILYSIDPFNGQGDDASTDTYNDEMSKLSSTLFNNFKETMEKYELLDYITIYPTTSEEANKHFPEKSIDFLFIDGNHDYDAVKKDYNLWSPLIAKGGIIVLHDVKANHVDGPKRIYNEKIINNKNWFNAHIVGEMGIATKN
jgi:predicted O-methyltransferase YrrM